jgi:murein DD-endopeptidase MepM/ murein hydrolase activator NlpD
MAENAEPIQPIEDMAPPQEDEAPSEAESSASSDFLKSVQQFLQKPAVMKYGMYAITFIVVVLAVWGVGSLIVHGFAATPGSTVTPTATGVALPSDLATPVFSTNNQAGGVFRLPEVLTTSAAGTAEVEDRLEYVHYIVQEGDTIFDIAERYGLAAETILWTNWYILGEMPDAIYPGNEVLIPPVDGAMYQWYTGDGLNGVSDYFSVSPEDIINFSLNNLDPDTIGNWSNPNIEAGTMLFVPGGSRPNTSWIPARGEEISGNSYLGPGACSGILYGNIGTGTFTWPTTAHYLSGYDYTPPVHNGLDFDGDFGSPIYAADSGVIIYSGWSDRGYGNLIVIDHDGGWQTYYAHLMDGTLLGCGTNVVKGELIASMGSTGNSTGPHLHFEMRLNGTPQNPWLYLN